MNEAKGRTLALLAAQHVMGWATDSSGRIATNKGLILTTHLDDPGHSKWNPLVSLEDAFKLVDKMEEKGFGVSLVRQDYVQHGKVWNADFWKLVEGDMGSGTILSTDRCIALTLAALLCPLEGNEDVPYFDEVVALLDPEDRSWNGWFLT